MNIKLKDHAFKETWVGMLAQYPQKPILWQLNDQVCTRQIYSSEVLFTDTCFDLFDFFFFFSPESTLEKRLEFILLGLVGHCIFL